jgi:hypothetical protein
VSFGITMTSNMGFGVVKEFLPDLGRAIAKKHKSHRAPTSPANKGRKLVLSPDCVQLRRIRWLPAAGERSDVASTGVSAHLHEMR